MSIYSFTCTQFLVCLDFYPPSDRAEQSRAEEGAQLLLLVTSVVVSNIKNGERRRCFINPWNTTDTMDN